MFSSQSLSRQPHPRARPPSSSRQPSATGDKGVHFHTRPQLIFLGSPKKRHPSHALAVDPLRRKTLDRPCGPSVRHGASTPNNWPTSPNSEVFRVYYGLSLLLLVVLLASRSLAHAEASCGGCACVSVSVTCLATPATLTSFVRRRCGPTAPSRSPPRDPCFEACSHCGRARLSEPSVPVLVLPPGS